jgi:hypothetical protein
MSEEEQEALKLLESLENDVELQKENHFAAIVDDPRFRELMEICRKERDKIYPALFAHLFKRRKFTCGLLLDLAIGNEMVEVIKPAISTSNSNVSYDTAKYVERIIEYGRRKKFLPFESPQERVLRVIDEADSDPRVIISSDPGTVLKHSAIIKLLEDFAGEDKLALMQGVMLHIKRKLSWTQPGIIWQVARKHFDLDPPEVPQHSQGRLAKINEICFIWGLANGLYPIDQEKAQFQEELLLIEKEIKNEGKYVQRMIGRIRAHFKKPILIWLCLDHLDSTDGSIGAIKILESSIAQMPYNNPERAQMEIEYATASWLRWGYEQGYILHNSYPEE